MISSLKRPPPDNTQHLQETEIHASSGIQTHNLSTQAAVDLRLRSHGQRDQLHRCFSVWKINANYGNQQQKLLKASMLYVDSKLLKNSVVYNWYKHFKVINHRMKCCQQARNIKEQWKCGPTLHNCDTRSMCDIWTANKTDISHRLVQSIRKGELSMQQVYDNSPCHTSITE